MLNFFANLTYKLENNPIFISIRKGLLISIPILILSSVVTILGSINIEIIQSFSNILDIISDSTLGLMSIFLICSISYFYSFELNSKNTSLQISSVITSISCFYASFGVTSNNFDISDFSYTSIFSSIVIAILATWIFHKFYNFHLFKFYSYSAGSDSKFHTAMSSIMPFSLCVILFLILNILIRVFLHVSNLNEILSSFALFIFQNGVKEDLSKGLLFAFITNFAWFFGIHGGRAMEKVSTLIFVSDVNNPSIISKTLIDNFSLMGGCGSTICLLISILLFSRIKTNRHLAYSSIPFAIFNINEILIFGMPIILNPIMFIPFIAVPVISVLITYIATIIGFIPIITNTVEWTTPVLLSGYMATGTINGSIVQLICIITGVLIYTPFISMSESIQSKQELNLIKKLTEIFKEYEKSGEPFSFLNRQDDIGSIAKSIAMQLKTDIEENKIPIYYQPQIGVNGNIKGAESLLRWRYKDILIYPPLTVAIALEDNLYDKLTERILQNAINDTILFCDKTKNNKLMISVNITAYQLSNQDFINKFINIVKSKNIEKNLCLEIVEGTNLEKFDNATSQLNELSKNNIAAAIDDFSMGHTSIKYLQENHFRFIKLDGALVKQISKNSRSKDIIRSIIELGNHLGSEIVAEYVETDELLNQLINLGCHYFQGYLFSPAIPPEKFIQFCNDWVKKDF